MTTPLSDDVLVQQALTDADAFAQLYRRHLKRVYSYLLSQVSNTQDAQDLTTQTFMSALDSLPTYTPQGTFAAWLIGIARRKAADHFRRQKTIITIDDIAAMSDGHPSVDEVVNRRLQMAEVESLLEHIAPDRAEALRLRFFGNLKMREIGEIMDKSEGAAKMLVSRALDDLRNLLNIQEKTS